MRSTRLIASIVLVLLCAPSCQADDDGCDKILSDGVFANANLRTDEHFAEHFRDWILTLSQSQASQAENAGVDVVIPVEGYPLPIGAKASTMSSQQWSQYQQQLHTHSVSYEKVLNSFQRSGDRGIIEGWVRCQELHAEKAIAQYGIVSHANVDWTNSVAEWKVEWRPIGSTLPLKPLKFDPPMNAQLQGNPPSEINANSSVVLAYKVTDKTKPVVMVLNTPWGGVSVFRSPTAPQKHVIYTVRLLRFEVSNGNIWDESPTKTANLQVWYDSVKRLPVLEDPVVARTIANGHENTRVPFQGMAKSGTVSILEGMQLDGTNASQLSVGIVVAGEAGGKFNTATDAWQIDVIGDADGKEHSHNVSCWWDHSERLAGKLVYVIDKEGQ